MEGIKNVILDLGGVLYDLDYNKTQAAFEALGSPDRFSQMVQDPVFDLIEEGKIEEREFIQSIRSRLSEFASDEQIIDAWNALLIGMKADKLPILEDLGKRYRLFLYSNTNAIHIRYVYETLQRDLNIPNLDAYFEEVFLSQDIKIRKPKKEGFEFILNQCGLKASETIFIDDSPQHIEGAKEAGIKAFWLNLSNQNLKGLLKDLEL